jgi:hypothetical protein
MDDSAPVPGSGLPSTTSFPKHWFDYVRPYASPGLSTCITEGLLRLDGARVAATWVDVVAMRIAEWAFATRQSVVLVSPDPYDLLVPLTAAAVHVWRMSELKKQIGGYPHTDVRVAIVTRRIQLRTAYRRLALRGAKLFDAVPAATRVPTGGIAVLGRRADADWGTLFVQRASELIDVKRLALVIVDLPVYDWEQLEKIRVPKIVVGHDPSDRLVRQLASSAPIFAWSVDDLRGLKQVQAVKGAALAAVAARLERLAAGTVCATVPVPSQGVSLNAALFWNDIGPLHRAARGSFLANDLASMAHDLFQDLIHLAVPVSFYEAQTGTSFRARLRDLKHEESRSRGELRDLYLPMVHAELQDLALSVGERPPKTDVLIKVLQEVVASRRNALLVARTATLARVYRAYLQQFVEFRRVRVASIGEVAEEMPADVAVLTGLAPAWARHLYASGIAAEIRILAYKPEGELPIGDAFVEEEYVRRAIAYQQRYRQWLARPALKARCWKALSGENLGLIDDEPFAPKVDIPHAATVPVPEAPDVPPGLWDVGLRSIDRPDVDEGIPALVASLDREPIEAVRVVFDDGRWVILERTGTVTRFNTVQQKAEPGTDVARLTVGDDVVFLDGDARKDILGKVLEVAKEIPQLATAATWVEYWRDALRRAKQRFGTYNAFGDELRARGCRRQTQTVRLWVVGTTIGPDDPLDVKRVGETIGDAPLRDHHEIVYGGIDAFRGAHAQLMERVGALALQVGPAASVGAIRADEVIDERSGLTASDFEGCVEILRVRSIDPIGLVSPAVLGRLREAREAEMSL